MTADTTPPTDAGMERVALVARAIAGAYDCAEGESWDAHEWQFKDAAKRAIAADPRIAELEAEVATLRAAAMSPRAPAQEACIPDELRALYVALEEADATYAMRRSELTVLQGAEKAFEKAACSWVRQQLAASPDPHQPAAGDGWRPIKSLPQGEIVFETGHWRHSALGHPSIWRVEVCGYYQGAANQIVTRPHHRAATHWRPVSAPPSTGTPGTGERR